MSDRPGCSRPHPVVPPGFAVWSGSRPYIWRTWKTEAEAALVRADLLRYHAPDGYWSKRLTVRWFAGGRVPNMGRRAAAAE